jgi:hypothetical protein
MTRPLLLLLIALTTGACAADDEGVPPDRRLSLRERLATPQSFQLDHHTGTVAFDAALDRGAYVDKATVELALTGGELVAFVDPDGVLELEELDIRVADATYGGIHLTDIHLLVTEPGVRLATEWQEAGDVVHGTVDADWTLRWAIANDAGRVYPLGDQRLRDLSLWLMIFDDGHHYRFELAAWKAGVVWTWADLVEFSDPLLLGDGAWDVVVE